jgi:hypothetical protein
MPQVWGGVKRKMVTIRQKQKLWECHDYNLTPEQYKEYKALPKKDRPNFLDSIGGTPAEYENEEKFTYEVVK